jgi:hypothetical protein
MMLRSSVEAWVARVRGPRGPKLVGAERVMHWLAVLACVFFGLVTVWECFGPPRAGHFGANAAYGIGGENMAKWRIFAVVVDYVLKPPTPDQYYCHHPYGISVLQAIAYVVFGHHWFTLRAGAMFCSVISPPLVYAFGRRAWGVIPASVATIFFAFTPVALSFSILGNLEEPTIAFGLLFGWATARLWETSKTRYLVLSTVGALGAANGDWAGLVFLAPVLGFGFLRAYVVPRSWYGRVDDRAYARWFAYAVTMAVCTVVVYLALFSKADKIGDLMGSYHLRSSGSEQNYADVLASQRRKMWLGVMLTPFSYGAIAVGIPLALIRLVKRPLEIFPIAWCISATFQYFVFKQGADIHIFWSYYYAPTAALAAGTLTATLLAGRGAMVHLAERLSAWRHGPGFQRFVRVSTAVVIVAALGVPLLLLIRIAVPMLVLGRKTSGRFDQGGVYVGTDADVAQFAQWAFSNVGTLGSTVQMYGRGEFGWSAEYAVNRPFVRVAAVTPTKNEDIGRIVLVDTRYESAKDLETIAKGFAVQSVGRFWRVDRAAPGAQLTALRYDEHQPNAFEWMFVSGTDLVRSISREEDPFQTWEIRDAFGLSAPPLPASATPRDVDEIRIAHNAAVRAGDTARASDLAAQAAGRVGKPLDLHYTGGVTLQGIDVQYGPAILVTLFWATDDTYKPKDVSYQLKCKIIAPPRLWKTELDYFEKDMVGVPLIRPAVWKPGGLYTQRFIALHRIGREECRASFSGEFHPVTGELNPAILTMD